MAVRSARPSRRLQQSRHRAGYTLIQLNVANAINASLYDKLSFNVLLGNRLDWKRRADLHHVGGRA
jgi:hypothetical protein